ncbi:MAG: CocE/NonD family hydrolase [Dehalococcoidia bacterium]|nr:CocE/NonD family hydrolase [Dehalococcoidia bacterium]
MTDSPNFGIVSSHNVMVPMRDGVRLATDVYRPADENGNAVEGRFPVIVGRTSYDKSNPVIWIEAVANAFVPRGYVVVLQDLRGRGDSEGTGDYFHTANQKEGLDGYDTIEWAAGQPWSYGKVGMVGASHGGIVQNMASLYRPPHLAALWVDVAPTNAFRWEVRQGGAMALHMYGALYLHGYDSQEIAGNSEAIERIEHGAERLSEEIWKQPFTEGRTPISVVPNLEKVLMHYYRDGSYTDWWKQESLDHAQHYDRMADIPAVYSSGWYDPFAAETSEQFAHMAKKNTSPQRLILGPWNHVSMRGKGASFVGEVDFGPTANWGDEVLNAERFRWFDRWLKGVETGVENDDPVRIFVMGGGEGDFDAGGRIRHGGGWRVEQEWPLDRAVETAYYLSADGGLGVSSPIADSGETSWVHDPENPVPSISGNVTGFYEWIVLPDDLDGAYVPQRARMRSLIPDGPIHQKERESTVVPADREPGIPALLADRADVNVFQTEPLEDAVEVTGPMMVNLWISSDAIDTDFTAKLIDVYPPSEEYPEGFHLPLEDSIRRARFRDGFAGEELMTPEEVYELQIELPPVSNRFVKGHRIRLDISSSNFPRFDVNPNTGEPIGRHTRTQKATNTVYMCRDHSSHIMLPIVNIAD